MPESSRAVRAFSFSSLLPVGAIALWVAGCGGSDAGCTGPFCVPPPEQPVAASIQPGPNDGRPGVANRQQPIDVVVTDSAGRGVSGVTVNFSVSSGGGTVSSPTAQSDNAGLAQVSWTLGPELGPQALQATATNATATKPRPVASTPPGCRSRRSWRTCAPNRVPSPLPLRGVDASERYLTSLDRGLTHTPPAILVSIVRYPHCGTGTESREDSR